MRPLISCLVVWAILAFFVQGACSIGCCSQETTFTRVGQEMGSTDVSDVTVQAEAFSWSWPSLVGLRETSAASFLVELILITLPLWISAAIDWYLIKAELDTEVL